MSTLLRHKNKQTENGNFFYRLYLNYKHIIPLLLYGMIYMSWFAYLEKTVTSHYRIIHVALDDYIPFCEVFVIPYFLWFAYVAVVVGYFFFKDKNEYYKVCIFLATGMTLFLIISTIWPNGHHLRPYIMPRDNVFTRMIAGLYRTDTATNLWPSIHVYNSLGCHFAVIKSRHLEKKPLIRISSALLCLSIILSTMLIKQHSVFDVLTAFILAAIMYGCVYSYDKLVNLHRSLQNKKRRNPKVL